MHSANNGESSNSCTLIIYSNTKHVLMFTDMFCCIVRNHTDFWMMMAEMQRKTKWMRRVMVEMRWMEIRSRKKKSRWLELQNFVFLYISTFSSFQVKFLFSFKQIFFKAALNSWNTTTSVLTQTTNSRL